jgi:hypothetical protein
MSSAGNDCMIWNGWKLKDFKALNQEQRNAIGEGSLLVVAKFGCGEV